MIFIVNLLLAQKYTVKKKIVVALSYGDNKKIALYTFAATRLFDFYYWYATPDLGKISDSRILQLKLGNPLDVHHKIDNIYYRLYEKGLVAINPDKESHLIKIKVPWSRLYNIDGQEYIVKEGYLKIELAASEGIVLLTYNPVNKGYNKNIWISITIAGLIAAAVLFLVWRKVKYSHLT